MKRKFLKIKVNCIEDFPLTIIDGSTLLIYENRKKHLHWDCYFSQVFVLLLNLILPTVVLVLIRMFLLTRSWSAVVVLLLSTLHSAVSVQTTTPTGEIHYSMQMCNIYLALALLYINYIQYRVYNQLVVHYDKLLVLDPDREGQTPFSVIRWACNGDKRKVNVGCEVWVKGGNGFFLYFHLLVSQLEVVWCLLFSVLDTVSVWSVTGHRAFLPCDLTPPTKSELVYLVLWYRGDEGEPIYRSVCQHSTVLSTLAKLGDGHHSIWGF